MKTNADMISSTIADINRSREEDAASQVESLIRQIICWQEKVRAMEKQLDALRKNSVEEIAKLRGFLASVSYETISTTDVLGTA